MKASFIFFVCIIFAAVSVIFLCGAHEALAVEIPGYTQLENLPGAEGKNKSFPEYVTAIYQIGLWVIGISAFFMLSVGGFMYLTSAGNTSSAGSAKGVIKDALIGLALGLSAWLIVNTINPDLTTFNVSGITTGTSSPIPPGGGTAPTEAAAKDAAAGIDSSKLVSTGDCKDAKGADVSPASNIAEVAAGNTMTACFHGCGPSSAKCTERVNVSTDMLNAINAVPGSYVITSISGGSHGAGSAHYQGKSIDVVPKTANHTTDWAAIRDLFIAKGALPNNPNRSGTFCEKGKPNEGAFSSDCSDADHIHVRFP